MQNWSRKQRTAFVYSVAMVGVYLSFRYLLPSILLFLLAYLLAHFFAPTVYRIHDRFHIPKSVITICLLLFSLLVFLFFAVFLGRQVSIQVMELMEHIPEYKEEVLLWLKRVLSLIEGTFHLKEGSLREQMVDFTIHAMEQMKLQAMPFLASFGVNFVVGLTKLTTALFVLVFATILCVSDLERLRRVRDYSVFSRELAIIRKPLALVGKAYLRTQAFLLVVIMTILVIGFSLIGNRYAVLLGILIGLLDALPLFGTGTVLIPWAIICLIGGSLGQAILLVLLYLICYFLREYIETKWMGDIMGMSPLETLIGMYVGLKLFSLWGLFLGPVGWLLVREIVKNQENMEKRS